jgi:hypothetical protein
MIDYFYRPRQFTGPVYRSHYLGLLTPYTFTLVKLFSNMTCQERHLCIRVELGYYMHCHPDGVFLG